MEVAVPEVEGMQPTTLPTDSVSTLKPERPRTPRRIRIVIVLLSVWAVAASLAFGWSLTVQTQLQQSKEQSAYTAVSATVWDIGNGVLVGSSAGETFLSGRAEGWSWTYALNNGWIGAAWMSAAAESVSSLSAMTDGNAVVQGLNLGGLDCVAERYGSIVEWAGTNPSIMNGTTMFTLYFGSVVNLTLDLGKKLENITYVNGGAPPWANILDRLNSPDADSIRSDLGALYVAGTTTPGLIIWNYACA